MNNAAKTEKVNTEHQERLRVMVEDIAEELEDISDDWDETKDLLSDLALMLLRYSITEDQRRARKQRQAEGIAAAKAQGVRFGRQRAELPENFETVRDAFRRGELSVIQAASLCGMANSTFYKKAIQD